MSDGSLMAHHLWVTSPVGDPVLGVLAFPSGEVWAITAMHAHATDYSRTRNRTSNANPKNSHKYRGVSTQQGMCDRERATAGLLALSYRVSASVTRRVWRYV